LNFSEDHQMIHIGICGANGKMGKRLISLLESQTLPELVLSAGFIPRQSPLKGKRLNDQLRYQPLSQDTIKDIDVLVDFSVPQAASDYMPLLRKLRKPAVIGTTGFTVEQKQAIQQLSQVVPIVAAPNMSIGVNVLLRLISKAAEWLPQDFKPFILEIHHIHKKDAPSGTAAQLEAEIKSAQKHTEIPIESIRAADVVGEHTVVFYGMGERLELTHRALSRDIFAKGALQAAHWVLHKKPGLYSMQHVLQGGHR